MKESRVYRRVAAVTLLAVVMLACSSERDVQFDSGKWKSCRPGFFQSRRQQMVDDLLVNYKLAGMGWSDVQSLLGPAADSEWTRKHVPANAKCYLLGQHGIDNEWLVLECAETGVVVSAKRILE